MKHEACLFVLLNNNLAAGMTVMDEDMIVVDEKTQEILANAKLLEAYGLEKP